MKRACPIEYCSYPVGECQGLCSTREETRQDIIGQNGNDGLGYTAEMKPETRIETILFDVSHTCTQAYQALQRKNLIEVERKTAEMLSCLQAIQDILEARKVLQNVKDITSL